MFPPALVAALAPVLIDKLTGKGKTKADTAPQAPDMLETLLTEHIAHEKNKASIRPKVMKHTGRLTIGTGLAYLGACFAPMSGYVEIETAKFAVDNLIWLFGGGAGTYLATHVTRSVDKAGEAKEAA